MRHVWLDLCAEAAICEDPARLDQLAYQIAEILGKEQQRVNGKMLSTYKNTPEQGAA